MRKNFKSCCFRCIRQPGLMLRVYHPFYISLLGRGRMEWNRNLFLPGHQGSTAVFKYIAFPPSSGGMSTLRLKVSFSLSIKEHKEDCKGATWGKATNQVGMYINLGDLKAGWFLHLTSGNNIAKGFPPE